MNIVKKILTVAGLFLTVMAIGQQHPQEIILQKVVRFLNGTDKPATHSVAEIKPLFHQATDLPETYLVSLVPQGFVVVSSTNKEQQILAWSLDHNFVSAHDDRYQTATSLLQEVAAVNRYNRDEGANRSINEIYGPYVHTMWGQVNCRDANGVLINVTNIYTPEHYAAGCVAISQATVLHHYRWPPKGVGSYTYSDNKGSSRGTYSVNYEEKEYRWDLMLERYRSKSSTIEQREAAGELAYDCAVSLQMDFESNGSTSNVNRIPSAIAQHFRFTALYRSKSSSTFWSLLDSNMVYKKPAVLSIENSAGGGHSVICDGLKKDENGTFYHLNMGWWGASNGWYKIRGSFDAGGYNRIIGAAMNILPEPMIIPPVIDADSFNLTLMWRYPVKAEAEAFQVQKKVNNGDWLDITNSTTDTVLYLLVDPEKEYQFRVRAKTNGKWYQNSWSTIETLQRNYLSTPETDLNPVAFYPNPCTEKLGIDFSIPFNGSIRVLNLSGQEILTAKYSEEKNILINTESWKRGIYFVQLSGNHFTFVKKILKQ